MIFTGISVLLEASLSPGSLSRIPMIPNSQAVRGVAASHDMLIHLFERVEFFLGRLNDYIEATLTSQFTALLGSIMAELLSVLALSTKMMTESRISGWSTASIFLAEYGAEKILKRLLGRTDDPEDRFIELDKLTKEESLNVVAMNMRGTHHFRPVFLHI